MNTPCKTVLFGLAVVLASGCHRKQSYETNVEIIGLSPVRKGADGKSANLDVKLSYVECPGTQIEVVRGDAAFAACLEAKHKTGDKVKVKLDYRWNDDGFYEYAVLDIDGCPRPPDRNDEASFKVIRDCSDWVVNGQKVGFECKYADEDALAAKCPWFRRH